MEGKLLFLGTGPLKMEQWDRSWGVQWEQTSTHPVSFHAYVTFEPRKAVLALGKTEVRGHHRR